MEKRILEQWLKAGYIDQGVFYNTEDGTPQGSIISPTLMNMALDGLEAAIRERLGPTTMRRAKVHISRFADDFIASGISKEVLTEHVQPIVEQFLEERNLNLSLNVRSF
jgi:RNA-directed DNA polymerase